jgi:4-amino-4-deoxy-L-arabinose transferase-like glycosyltransferase
MTPLSRSTWALVLGVTLARLLYLGLLCPYTLVEDEAWYWLWSRSLELSYASKGPGIAWLIRLSTLILGDSEFGVRAPSVLASALAALALARLCVDMSGDPRRGFYTAACFFLAPLFQVMGLLMTIDSPYVCAWALAMLLAWRGLVGGSLSALVLLGLSIGVGFLFKYTILLLIPGLLGFAFVSRRSIPRPSLPASLAGAVLILAGLAPVLLWNSQHSWPTVHHLLDHLRPAAHAEPKAYSPLWTLEYLGVHLVIAGPVTLLAWHQLRRGARAETPQTSAPHEPRDRASLANVFLVACALPLLVFYLAVSFRTRTQGNWAAAAHLSTIALAGLALPTLLSEGRRHLWRAVLIVGVGLGVLSFRLDLLARLVPAIPAHRFTGATQLAAAARTHLEALRARTHLEPFILTDHYGPASLLEFYTHTHAFCASALLSGGRRTQFDQWAHTDLARAHHLLGRPALLVGDQPELWRSLFDRVEPLPPLHESLTRKGRSAFLGFGFHGVAR